MPAANNLLPPIERKGFIDPLLECLVILTKLNGNPYSAESLSAGLPMEKDRINSTLFVRAAKRIGYSARVVKRPIFNISPLLLPAVVILHKRQACILTKIIDNETLEVIFPEAGDGTTKVKISELAEQYTGYSIFVKQSFDFEQRANEYQLDKPQSWFWGTLWQYRNIYYQVIFGTLLINIFTLASPLFAMNVYDRVVPNSAEATLWVLAIGISIVFLFDFALRLLRGYLMDLNGKKSRYRDVEYLDGAGVKHAVGT